jgi:hypothetical protein
MKRLRTPLIWPVLLAILVMAGVGMIVWAANAGGSPSRPLAASRSACDRGVSVSTAPVPPALLAVLPVLGRSHSAQDTPPREALTMLSSLGTGIELDHAQLVRTSAQGGRAWVVPVLHEAPQVIPSVACQKQQLAMFERAAHASPGNTQLATLVARQRADLAAAERYVAGHRQATPPGVIVFTQGPIVQGADGTLNQVRAGAAFTTGECAGPDHDLLTVSGLAPAGTSTIELQAPDGTTETQPANDGAYSFQFAPSASAAGLPDRLVLLDAQGTPVQSLALPARSFSVAPACTITQAVTREAVIPAGFTVIGANAHGPDGVGYTIAVESGGAPACDPIRNVEQTDGSLSGGTRYCRLSFTAQSLTPTFMSGGCGPQTVEINGTVSATVKRLRFTAANGQTITTPVFAAPPSIAHDYGVILAIGPASILTSNPTVEAIAANGRVLNTSHALSDFANCGKHYPVQQLAPGTLTLAHAQTPQGQVAILLHRIRFLGHDSLCIGQRPQGNEQCARYPIGPSSGQGIGNAPMWLMAGGHGSCKPPRYQVITGVILHAGLTPWLRTPTGTTPMPTVAVPRAFDIPGPLFYAVLTSTPDTIQLRSQTGQTVYTRPAVQSSSGYCGGLNPDTSD